MKLVFAGTPEVAVPALDALIASGPARGRRRRHPARRARRAGPAAGRQPGRASAPRRRASRCSSRSSRGTRTSWPGCGRSRPDCCPVVAYGALLPRVALDIPAHGWVNLHFSLLPAWRGAAPVQHAVLAGDEMTGASTFLIEEGLDSGPGLRGGHRGGAAHRHQRRPADPARLRRCRAARRDHGRHRGRHAEGRAAARRGRHPRARRSPSRTRRSTGRRPRCASTGSCAAARPRPGAWTVFRGERLKLISVALRSADRTDLAPGELAVGKNAVYVGHRLARRRAALGPAAGQEADAGGGLGARGADRATGRAAGGAEPGVRLTRAGPSRAVPVPRRSPSASRSSGRTLPREAGRTPRLVPGAPFVSTAASPRRKPYRRPQKDPVRILAFEALRAVDERDAYANLVLPPLLRKAREKRATSTRGTRRWPPSWSTGRCAGRARTTRSSPPASTGRCARSTRRCWTC